MRYFTWKLELVLDILWVIVAGEILSFMLLDLAKAICLYEKKNFLSQA